MGPEVLGVVRLPLPRRQVRAAVAAVAPAAAARAAAGGEFAPRPAVSLCRRRSRGARSGPQEGCGAAGGYAHGSGRKQTAKSSRNHEARRALQSRGAHRDFYVTASVLRPGFRFRGPRNRCGAASALMGNFRAAKRGIVAAQTGGLPRAVAFAVAPVAGLAGGAPALAADTRVESDSEAAARVLDFF